jgi:hypothetical protein
VWYTTRNPRSKQLDLLPGRYKGTRRRGERPVIVKKECPGCGWKSDTLPVILAEQQYARHLQRIHYGTF